MSNLELEFELRDTFDQPLIEKLKRILFNVMTYASFDGHWEVIVNGIVKNARGQNRAHLMVFREGDEVLCYRVKPSHASSTFDVTLYPLEEDDALNLRARHAALRKVPTYSKVPMQPSTLLEPPKRTGRKNEYGDVINSGGFPVPTKKLLAMMRRTVKVLGLPALPYVGCGMFTGAVTVYPNQAKDWLDNYNYRYNRSCAVGPMAKYGQDLQKERWHLTHQGMAFFFEELLLRMADAQHRLSSIVEENLPMKTMVTINLPMESIKGLDQARSRSTRDQLSMLGDEKLKGTLDWAKFAMGGIANSTARRDSSQEVVEFVIRHQIAADFIDKVYEEYTPHRGIRSAPIKSAIFRAFYHVDGEVLEAFSRALITGDPVKNLSFPSIKKFREQLIGTKFNTSKSADKCVMYATTTRLISFWEENQSRDQVRKDTRERYLLPEEPGYLGYEEE